MLFRSPERKVQQLQAQAAAQKLVDDNLNKLNAMSYQSMDVIKATAAGGSDRAGEAKKILDMVASANGDEKAIMQASGNLTWLRKKLSADKLYTARNILAGDNPVTPMATIKSLEDTITKASSDVHVDKGFINRLQGWRNQLENPTAQSFLDEDPVQAEIGRASCRERV